jgi:serine phosphatase RsbU (regulator of sigma subunit)
MAPPHRRTTRIRTPRAAAAALVACALAIGLAATVFAPIAGARPKVATPPASTAAHGRPAAAAPAPAEGAPAGPAATTASLPRGPEPPSAREAREARQRAIAEHRALQAQRALEHREADERAAAERRQAARERVAEGRARLERQAVGLAQSKLAHQEAIAAQHAAIRADHARERERAGRSSGSSSGPPTSSGSATPVAVKASAPSPVASPPAPAPVVTQAPVAQSAPASSPPVRASRRSRRPGTARRTARTGGRATAPRTTAAAPALPRAAAGSLPATSRSRTAPRARSLVRHTGSQGPAAIVNTVTKIIDVVPALLRVLIAVLAAVALALGIASRVVARRARRLARQRRELLEDVGLLQAALLPELPARIGPVGTSAAYRPASGPAAGGDFFDVFALADGRLAVIVGDVSGHGRHALPHTTVVRFTLRTYLEAGAQPAAALQAAAPALERQLGDSFATVAVATYEPSRRLLRYACAGHPPPLIIGSTTPTHLTVCSAPPIGIGEPTGTRETAVRIPGEALICFFTDGVIEARLRGGLYGQERLTRVLESLGQDATAAELLERVADESDHHPDDMAACILHVAGSAAEPVVERELLELDRDDASQQRVRRLLLATGLSESSADAGLASARALLREHPRVVLEVGDMDTRATVQAWPQNVSVLRAAWPQGAAEGTG